MFYRSVFSRSGYGDYSDQARINLYIAGTPIMGAALTQYASNPLDQSNVH